MFFNTFWVVRVASLATNRITNSISRLEAMPAFCCSVRPEHCLQGLRDWRLQDLNWRFLSSICSQKTSKSSCFHPFCLFRQCFRLTILQKGHLFSSQCKRMLLSAMALFERHAGNFVRCSCLNDITTLFVSFRLIGVLCEVVSAVAATEQEE